METWNPREHWIIINDHPDYEVSNLGKVRNKRTGRLLEPQLNREYGYLRVCLNSQRYYIHRLVAAAFFDCNLKGLDVNHIDGNKLNNAIWNLEICTRKENIRHAFDTGLKFPSVMKVVRCKYCKCRYEYDICEGKSDDFYCAFAEHM